MSKELSDAKKTFEHLHLAVKSYQAQMPGFLPRQSPDQVLDAVMLSHKDLSESEQQELLVYIKKRLSE